MLWSQGLPTGFRRRPFGRSTSTESSIRMVADRRRVDIRLDEIGEEIEIPRI